MKNILEIAIWHHSWDSRVFYKQAVSLSKEFNVKCLWWVFSLKKWTWFENWINNIENIWLTWNRLLILFKAIIYWLKNKSDIYVAHDIDSYIVVVFVKLFRWNSKIVFDSHEYYDEMYKIKNYSLLEKFVFFSFSKILKNLTIKLFSWINVVTEDMKNYYNIKTKEVLYNFPLSKQLSKIEVDEKLKNKYKDDFILIFQWWVTKQRWILEYLKIINEVKNDITNVKLLILWPINNKDFEKEIYEYINKYNLDSYVEILWKLPLFDVYKYTKIANIWLNFLQSSFNNDNGIQIKIFEYLYLDTPILWTNNNHNFINFIVNNNCWLAVEYWNLEDEKKWVLEIYNNYDLYLSACKKNKDKFIWENEDKKLLKFYKKI